ncbi:MAG: ABC transporter ATP-binding protein [Candidatus Zixiibacteriota bacterium]
MNLYRRTFSALGRFWTQLLTASALSALHGLLSAMMLWMIGPLLMTLFSANAPSLAGLPDFSSTTAAGEGIKESLKQFVESLVAAPDRQGTLIQFCKIILIVVLLRAVIYYIQNVIMAFVQQSVVRHFRDQLFEKYQRLSLAWFHRQRTGDIVSRVTNDVQVLNGALDLGFNHLVGESTQVIAFASILFIISWKLTLFSFIVLPVIFGFIWFIGKKLRKYSERSQERMSEVTSVLEEAVNNIRIIKAFSMEEFEKSRFMAATSRYFRSLLRMARVRHLASPTNDILAMVAFVAILYYAGSQIISGGGEIDAGDFLTFLVAMFSMIKPVKSLTQIQVKLEEGMAAAQRVFEVIDAEETVADPPQPRKLQSTIEEIRYDKVAFSYHTGIPVLTDVSFSVRRGEIIALVGPSGAGKSTLVDLLPRFYDPTGGTILFDGIDIRHVTLASLRGLMGIVTQETILFNDTVRSNIAYGLVEVSQDNIERAARMANAHEFILQLRDGYDTVVGQRGVMLSGGQKQRLAIARALLKNPQILILDEATSALDTESEVQVQEAIDRLMGSRTTFVVAHRLSTVQHADRILVIDKGKIVETGKHDELLTKGGLYNRLYEMQFRNRP